MTLRDTERPVAVAVTEEGHGLWADSERISPWATALEQATR